MFDSVEIDGRAGCVITQMDGRATDRTECVTPIVELTLINRFDHNMKVAGEIDQDRRDGLGTSERDLSTGDSIALNSDGLAILAGWPSVMAADQRQSNLVDLHPNKSNLCSVEALAVANHNFHPKTMMEMVVKQ